MMDFAEQTWFPIARLLGATLLHFLWQGLVALLVGVTLMSVMRRRSSNARYLALLLLLAATTFAPIVTFGVLWNTANIDEAATISFDHSRTDQKIQTFSDHSSANPHLDQRPVWPEQRASTSDSWPRNTVLDPQQRASFATRGLVSVWAAAFWLIGVLFYSTRLLIAGWSAQLASKASTSPIAGRFVTMASYVARRMEVDRTIVWLQSQVATVPYTTGWMRPVVVMPLTALNGLSDRHIECLMAHELAHIRRWDYLINLWQCVAEVFLFYHPAVRWISRQIRLERELCCDRLAADAMHDRMTYSRALLTVAATAVSQPTTALTAVDGELEQRLRVLLKNDPVRRRSASAICLSLLLLMTGFAWIGCAPEDQVTDQQATAKTAQTPPIRFFTDGLYEALPISGRVVDEQGRPVPAADVYLREAPRGQMSNGNPVSGQTLAHTRTTQDGSFLLRDVPVDDEQRGLDLIVLSRGQLFNWMHLRGGIAHRDLMLRPNRAASVQGTVTDEAGQPITEAEVALEYVMTIRHIMQADLEEGRWPRSDDPNYLYLKDFTPTPVVRTDRNGRFVYSSLPAPRGICLRVRHPAFERSPILTATVAEIDAENRAKMKRNVRTGALNVAVPRARILTVKVVYDDTGQPAAGAWATLNHNRNERLHADAHGELQFGSLPSRDHSVNVFPSNKQSYLGQNQRVNFGPDEFRKTITVRLQQGTAISGTLLNDETGEGIGNAVVTIATATPVNGPLVDHDGFLTLPDGSFQTLSPPGRYNLILPKPITGYRSPTGEWPAVIGTFEVEKGADIQGITIRLKPAAKVIGSVIRPDGQAAADVTITATTEARVSEIAIRKYREDARSDEAGRFELNDLHRALEWDAAPRDIEIYFRDRSKQMGATHVLESVQAPADLPPDLQVRLHPLGTVRGRFVHAQSGKPIPNVRVALLRYHFGDPEQRRLTTVAQETRSDRQGRFQLTGVFPQGAHLLAVRDNRFRYFRSPRIEGESGRKFELGDLRLQPHE